MFSSSIWNVKIETCRILSVIYLEKRKQYGKKLGHVIDICFFFFYLLNGPAFFDVSMCSGIKLEVTVLDVS